MHVSLIFGQLLCFVVFVCYCALEFLLFSIQQWRTLNGFFLKWESAHAGVCHFHILRSFFSLPSRSNFTWSLLILMEKYWLNWCHDHHQRRKSSSWIKLYIGFVVKFMLLALENWKCLNGITFFDREENRRRKKQMKNASYLCLQGLVESNGKRR